MTAGGEGSRRDVTSGGRQSSRPWSWLVLHPVEIAFAVVIGVAFVHGLRVTSGAYFFGDDWKLLYQGGSFGGMLEPYNGHLSVTILVVYRVLIDVFGFTYWPFQTFGLLCLAAIPAAYFVTTRRVLGPPLAALAALSLLGFSEMELNPAWFNHYLVLVGAIVCGAALNRGRRADVGLAVALAFSLCAAGGGLAVAVACLVHSACTRAPLRRWAAVLGPCALWGLWWLVEGRGAKYRSFGTPTFAESVDFARDVAWSPFDHLGLGSPLLAGPIFMAFVAWGLWRLRLGLATGANFLAWSAAIVVWSAGLAYARGSTTIFGELPGITFRYQLLAVGFALLAVVPRDPVRWPSRLPLATSPRWLTAGSIVVLVAGAWMGIAIRDAVDDQARVIASFTRITQGEMVVVDLGSDVIPDDAGMGPRFFWVHAENVRTVLRQHDNPFKRPLSTADQQLVDLGSVAARPDGTRDLECRPLTEPMAWPPRVGRPLYLWSDQPFTVYLRRFGSEWVKIIEGEADSAVAVSLPPLGVDRPWQVRADGACQAARRGAG